ncbi:MAG: sodium-independent anion transporter [Magnetococcales bacterium]|nr:sodium-independent anion transporter [Magnetococcales bacterium]
MHHAKILLLLLFGLLFAVALASSNLGDGSEILFGALHPNNPTLSVEGLVVVLLFTLWWSRSRGTAFSAVRRRKSVLTECPQLKMLRIHGVLDSGVTSPIREIIARHSAARPRRKHLALIAEGVESMDPAFATMMAREAQQFQSRKGGFYLVQANTGVLHVLEQTGVMNEIGRENIFSTKEKAIQGIFSRLDANECQHCPVRGSLDACDLVAPQPLATDNSPPLLKGLNVSTSPKNMPPS